MNTYQIIHKPDNDDWGNYDACDEEHALTVLADENGYDSFEKYSKENKVSKEDLQVILIKIGSDNLDL